MKKLTIAIPTYNRPVELTDTLRQLFRQPQIEECAVIVIDNASSLSMEEVIRQEVPSLFSQVTIRRNIANVGLSGNIIKCMEVAETEWLWILADDDNLADNAIPTLLETTAAGFNLDFILFGQYEGQTGGIEADTVASFVEGVDYWTRLGFLSTGLYRTSRFQSVLNVGTNYAYTLFPFVAMLLHGMANFGWRAALDSRVLVHPAHKAENTWALIVAINAYMVAELVEHPVAAKRLLSLASKWCLGPVGLTHDFALRKKKGISGLSRLSYEHKMFLISSVSFRTRLLAIICRSISHFPSGITLAIIKTGRMIMKKEAADTRGEGSIFNQI